MGTALNLHGQRMGATLFQSLEGFMVDGNTMRMVKRSFLF